MKRAPRLLLSCLLCLLSSFSLLLFSPGRASCAELKLGVLPAADSIVLHVAADEGLFAKQGLQVELIPFQSALELGAAMRAKALDGHFGDIINVLLQREGGADQAIVATTTHSSPAGRCFGLVLSPVSKAKSLADLKGADIAVSSATIIDFLLTRLLAQEGLAPDHFQRRDIRQIPVRLQMLLSGQLEAALLPEPLVSLVEAKGAKTLLDDRKLNTPLAVIALRKDWTDADTVHRFRAALYEAARRIDANPEAYKKMMLAKGLLPRGAAESYTMLRFASEDPKANPGTSPGTSPDAGQKTGLDSTALPPLPTAADIAAFAAWMRDAGMLKNIPAYEDVVIP